MGNAYFEYRGKVRAAFMVLGGTGIFLSGVTMIEAFSLTLNPVRRA
jgi:hypothetical protein